MAKLLTPQALRPLALAHGGSTVLDLAQVAAVAVQDKAALIVLPAAPAEAQSLALLDANTRRAIPELILEAADIPVKLVPDLP